MMVTMNDKTWHIKFYGTRGSTPVCDIGFQEFGGNTTCIYVDLLRNDRSKAIVIIDAGTGIRNLGKDIGTGNIPNVETIFLLLTHFHWDHIQGLPFFDAVYESGQRIKVFSPHHKMKKKELKHIFEVQTQKEYFPVQLKDMGAKFEFVTKEKHIGEISAHETVDFSYKLHNHPGGAFSYRFEAYGVGIVFCTDIEHSAPINPEIVNFCKGADILVHDAHFTDKQLESHQGWGHSSYSQAIKVAKLAEVKQLVLTHHHPDHDDNFLREMEKECQQKFPNCILARDGMQLFV